MAMYKYRSLAPGEIRIVLLHPAPKDSLNCPLHISIHHHWLGEDEQAYKALSYVWGEDLPSHPISSDEGSVLITTSLKEALFHLRPVEKPCALWIDALCINQQNDIEKQGQISIMRQIFHSASETIVWLGTESDDAALAIRYFNEQEHRMTQVMADIMNYYFLKDRSKLEMKIVEKEKLHIFMLDSTKSGPLDTDELVHLSVRYLGHSQECLFHGFDQLKTQTAIANFLSRSWFRRAWTIQEFVVSKKITMQCGSLVTSWAFATPNFTNSFIEARLTWYDCVRPSQRKAMFRGIKQMLHIQERRRCRINNKTPMDKTFSDILKIHRGSQAARPEDKIWALSGLIEDETYYSFVSSFSGKSKRELYISIAESFVNKWRGEAVLAQAASSAKHLCDLPSWVPDWSELPTTVALEQSWAEAIQKQGPRAGISGGRGKGDRYFRVDEEVLTTLGSIFQEVVHVGSDEDDRVTDAPNLSRFLSITHDLLTYLLCWPAPSYPSEEGQATVLNATLQAGKPLLPGAVVASLNEMYWDPLADLEIDVPTSDSHKDIGAIQALQSFCSVFPESGRVLARAVAGRKAILCADLDAGTLYLGLAPLRVRKSDKICILRGCPVPFVLRPSSNGKYKLVGDCYVHGIMRGEIVDRLTWKRIEIE